MAHSSSTRTPAAISCLFLSYITCVFYHLRLSSYGVSSVVEMARKEQFSWSDDETELLLHVTLEYKTEKIARSEDWESIRSKYNDIWERLIAQISERIEERSTEDFPHSPEEITKAMVTSKLKGKYL